MIRNITVLLLCLLSSSVIYSADAQDNFEKLLQQSLKDYKDKDYASSKENLEKAKRELDDKLNMNGSNKSKSSDLFPFIS